MKGDPCLRCAAPVGKLRVFLCRPCARVLPSWVSTRRNRGRETWRREIETYLKAERSAVA